jgi:hypothetical protein
MLAPLRTPGLKTEEKPAKEARHRVPIPAMEFSVALMTK